MADEGIPHDAGVKEARERVELRRGVEQSDLADAKLAEQLVLEKVGTADFHSGRRALQKYLGEASPADRAAIAKGMPTDGRPLNAEQLEVLAQRVIGDLPMKPEDIAAELEASRKRMRDDPRGWFADDRAQLRYRRLLVAKGQ